MPGEPSESLQLPSPGPRKTRRPAGRPSEMPSVDHTRLGSKCIWKKSLRGSVLKIKCKPFCPLTSCGGPARDTHAVPSAGQPPRHRPTLRVSISERLEVLAEELLLLRGLGQGAVGYAWHLGLGQLFCGPWASWGEAKGRRGGGQERTVNTMSHGRRPDKDARHLTMEKAGLARHTPCCY